MASKDTSGGTGKKKKDGSHENRLKPKTSSWTSKPTLYVFSIVILGVIIVSFIGGPIVGQIAAPSGSVEFGRYRGRPIELSQGSYFQTQAAQLGQQFGNPQSTVEMYQLYRQAFEQTLLHTAVIMEAEDSGMTVSSSRINQAIVQLPQFQQDGQFSQQALDNVSQDQLMNLRRQTRENLIYEGYVTDVLGGFNYSDREIEFFARQGSTERRFRVARFAFDNIPDSLLVDFGSDNSELFTNAELSVINVGPDLELAEDVRERIAAGSDSFEAMAQEFSVDEQSASDGGNVGRRYRFELEQEILDNADIDTLFELESGSLSAIIDTQFGYAIYRLDSAAVAPDFEDETVLSAIRSYMQEFERGTLEDYILTRAEEFVFAVRDGASFTDVGDFASITETAFFPINFGNQPYLPSVETTDGESLSGAASHESFFRSAFTLEQGEISDPIILDDYIIAFELIEERTQEPQETEAIAATVPQLYQQYQSREIERSLLDPSLIEDNFNQAFTRTFMQPQQQSGGQVGLQ